MYISFHHVVYLKYIHFYLKYKIRKYRLRQRKFGSYKFKSRARGRIWIMELFGLGLKRKNGRFAEDIHTPNRILFRTIALI